MMIVNRICPVACCDKALKPGMLMCLGHWRRVPRALQRQVWDTWRSLSRVMGRPLTEKTDPHVAYAMARQAAIDAVDAKLAAESAPRMAEQ